MHTIISPNNAINTTIYLNESKSISNRVLILQQIIKILNAGIFPKIIHLSDADDTKLMQEALNTDKNVFNIKNAGTCLRFLTAFFAAIPGKSITLLCDERMMNRPLMPLLSALKTLGSHITCLNKNGFAPIKIEGKSLNGGIIDISGTESSQFISALMLIAPLLKQPITINFKEKPVSFTYIKLTQHLINVFGGNAAVNANRIFVDNKINNTISEYVIEKDWSSAAFWFMAAALNKDSKIYLPYLQKNSFQGDSILYELAPFFGVKSTYQNQGVLFEHQEPQSNLQKKFNLINHPDIAPALISIACALNLKYHFTGLETLQFKESNRLEAIKTELEKTGCEFNSKPHELEIIKGIQKNDNNFVLNTYNDHRLAMAFAMLSLVQTKICLDNLFVTEKSYPQFINHLKNCNFTIH